MSVVRNTLISFDPSTTCTGWAVFTDGKLMDSGFVRLKGTMGMRLAELYSKVGGLILAHQATAAATEEPMAGGYVKAGVRADKGAVVQRAVGVVQAACAAVLGAEAICVNPSAGKKALSGNGHCPKDAMPAFATIYARPYTGKLITSDDEAHAIGVGLAALGMLREVTE